MTGFEDKFGSAVERDSGCSSSASLTFVFSEAQEEAAFSFSEDPKAQVQNPKQWLLRFWLLVSSSGCGREVRKREQECSAQQVQAKGCGSLGLKARREGAGQREQDHQHWEKADCRKEKKGK